MPGRKSADAVETITFWIVGIGLSLIPLLVFFFSFGNVGAFLESLGMEHRIAYLNGPAVDLFVTVCVVASSYLAAKETDKLWPLHLFTLVCGAIMVLLNTGAAIHDSHWRLAAVDCVGPALLIGWGALAPWLWRNMSEARRGSRPVISARHKTSTAAPAMPPAPAIQAAVDPATGGSAAAPAMPSVAALSRKTATLPGGNVADIAAAGRRSTARWAELALPLWERHVETYGSAPNATQLCAALRHAHPRAKIPASDRSERIIRGLTEQLVRQQQAGGGQKAG